VSDKTIEEYGLMYGADIVRLIAELVDAARTGDEERVEEIGGFAGELHALIGELLIGAAARGQTMTGDEAAMVFHTGGLN
jgi:hypothetical protein